METVSLAPAGVHRSSLRAVPALTVGTRVSYALPYCGQGVIVAIHGAQLPESVQTMLGGAGVRGGNAHFDVVFENGSVSHKLPEAIVRGIQWTIYDEQASAEEIAQLLQNSERKIAADTLARQNAEKAFCPVTRGLPPGPPALF